MALLRTPTSGRCKVPLESYVQMFRITLARKKSYWNWKATGLSMCARPCNAGKTSSASTTQAQGREIHTPRLWAILGCSGYFGGNSGTTLNKKLPARAPDVRPFHGGTAGTCKALLSGRPAPGRNPDGLSSDNEALATLTHTIPAFGPLQAIPCWRAPGTFSTIS